MADISLEQIKKLREETNAGVMDAKRALADADGDFKRAKELIKEKGLARSEKKADREAKAGFIFAYIHGNGSVGVLIELNCETDFVAKTEQFNELAKEIAMQVAAMGGEDIDEVLGQAYIRNAKIDIKQLIMETSAQVGENIQLKRFVRYELGA